MRTKAVESGGRLPHAWVKVERRGNEGVGFVSADGVEWEEVQRHVIPGLSETVYAGIVAIGNQPTNVVGFDPVDAGVCDVELIGLESVPQFRRGDANASGAVNVTDVIVTLGILTGGDVPCDDAADSKAGSFTEAIRSSAGQRFAISSVIGMKSQSYSSAFLMSEVLMVRVD